VPDAATAVDDVARDSGADAAGGTARGDPDDGGTAPDGSDSDTTSIPSSHAVLGYALLFSLPVGVGVAVMLLQVTGGGFADALVLAPSVALAAGVFLLVVGIGVGGSAEP